MYIYACDMLLKARLKINQGPCLMLHINFAYLAILEAYY